MKSNNTSLIAHETIDTYLKMIFGIMSLGIPQVQNFLNLNFSKASIESSYKDEYLIIKVNDLLNNFQKGLIDLRWLQNSFRQINRMFLLAMWDILISHKNYDNIANEPEIQFFRHIRNGCAHGNQMNFVAIDKPAEWRDKKITDLDKNKNVFPDILKDGDPILLVIDINNKYFFPIDFAEKTNTA